MKKIDLTFTRDFSVCVADFWHILLTKELKREIGVGINRQIMRYTGRAMETYRESEEMERIKVSILNRPTDDSVLSQKKIQVFINNVKAVRVTLKKLDKAKLEILIKNFDNIEKYFRLIYPLIVITTFLPSAWKNDYLTKHPDGDVVIKRWYEARVFTEGIFEEIDAYWKYLIKKLLIENDLDNKYFNVVRYQELIDMMVGKTVPSEIKLEERLRGCILYKGGIIIGKLFNEFLKENNYQFDRLSTKDINEIKGQVASQGGIIQGIVKVILNKGEMEKFKPRDILVTTMTSPEYVPIMKDSAAIITDEGGITCHAAIVSRELKIPCVIGTKIATKIFKDGDRVEVDAERGIVKKI